MQCGSDRDVYDRSNYIPQKELYEEDQILVDLLKFAAENLVDNGRLVFLLPIDLIVLLQSECFLEKYFNLVFITRDALFCPGLLGKRPFSSQLRREKVTVAKAHHSTHHILAVHYMAGRRWLFFSSRSCSSPETSFGVTSSSIQLLHSPVVSVSYSRSFVLAAHDIRPMCFL